MISFRFVILGSSGATGLGSSGRPDKHPARGLIAIAPAVAPINFKKSRLLTSCPMRYIGWVKLKSVKRPHGSSSPTHPLTGIWGLCTASKDDDLLILSVPLATNTSCT